MIRRSLLLALGLLLPSALHAQIGTLGEDGEGPEVAVHAALNAFHQAASDAAFDRYIGLFTEDGVFLGTDATERWTVAEFAAFTRPYFEQGRGWTYVPTERFVTMGPGGEIAWFDERLQNEGLGETRGSGVLVRVNGLWRVAQYNLTIPIPNALANEVVERIRENAGG